MRNEKKYPRVLIVNTQSIKKRNATGITLRSLWQEWPQDRIMELYLDEYENQVEYNRPIKSICIPTNIINKMAHNRIASKINKGIKVSESEDYIGIKTKIRQAIVLALDIIPAGLSSSIIKEVDEFKPDIIYTLGASVCALNLSYKLSNKYRIPILIHYMDNWPEHLQWDENWLIWPYKVVLDYAHKKCLKKCCYGLAISPKMAKAYSEKYGIPFSILMNCINVNEFHMESKAIQNPAIMLYAGGMHLNRWKALNDIDSVIKKNNLNVELHIYSKDDLPHTIKSRFSDKTFFHPPVSHSDVKRLYEKADILLHTETNSPILRGFFKYSISTKIPEYLSSGRITLFYGPRELGLYEYLRINKAAFVADNRDELEKVMIEILNGKSQTEILHNAYILATNMHDTTKAWYTLHDVIIKAIHSNEGREFVC